MKIIHYRNKCIGCNSCVEHDPESWEISDEDGKALLKNSVKKKNVFVKNIDYVNAEKCIEAAEDCPVNIIKVLR